MSEEPTVEMTLNEMLEIAAEFERHENTVLALKVQDGLKKLKFITQALEMRHSAQEQQKQQPRPQPQRPQQQPQPQTDDFGEPIQQPPRPRPTLPKTLPKQPKDEINNSWKSPRPIPSVQAPNEEDSFMEADEMP
jgi:hypothetical protein